MLWILTALLGCSREDYYADRSLYDNIREVYEDCEEGKIAFKTQSQHSNHVYRLWFEQHLPLQLVP